MLSNPEFLKKLFVYLQIGIGALFLALLYWRFGREDSAFRTREADRKRDDGKSSKKGPDLLAQARMNRSEANSQRTKPLQLEGIRVDGAPHEILGVSEDADRGEIQKAYKVLIARYHPDKVGRPGTREWTDAQKIAEAINAARDHLLSRAKR